MAFTLFEIGLVGHIDMLALNPHFLPWSEFLCDSNHGGILHLGPGFLVDPHLEGGFSSPHLSGNILTAGTT
jgi:hypothetical protein